jgi:OmcA/MtrC family decaheme c-type cytochrome
VSTFRTAARARDPPRERSGGSGAAEEERMKAWRLGVAVGAFAAAAMLGLASCGDDDDDDGGGAAAPQVDPDPVTLDIQAATLPEFASTARPTVTFRVLDGNQQPIDLEAELATTAFPNLRSPGRAPTFTLAMLDPNGDYVSYYSTTRAPRDFTYIADPEVIGTDVPFTPPVGTHDAGTGVVSVGGAPSVTQATSVAVTTGPNLRTVGNRVYEFTFPALTSTAGFDRARTHTVAGWVVRRPNSTDQDIAFDSFNFVPTGGAAAELDQVVTDQTCNRCHGVVQAHGTRRGVPFCITCHSPQTNDPETARSVDFKVMIHKIHYGSGLPSVRQGDPYFIVGNSQSIHDWSDAAFPWHDHGVQHCTVCHTGGEDSGNWRTKPTLATCTSCHDNVQFTATGDPSCGSLPANSNFENCVHTPGPIAVTNPNDPASCVACHGPNGIAAIDRFHHGD